MSDPMSVQVRPAGARALVSLLRRSPDYRRLFFASVVSMMGDWFAFVAVSGMTTELTGRAGMGALVYAASVLPVFLFSPLAGVVGDRLDRKRVLVFADAARILPALGLVAALRLDSPVLALTCVALLAALSAFFEPISEAVVPNLVEPADLSLAQAAMGTVWGTMLFVGASVGGVVSATLGREASFYLNAATFAVSLGFILRVRRPMQEARRHAHEPFFEALVAVWRLAKARRVTAALLVTKTAVGLGQGIVGLLPAFALARYGAGDAGLGLLLSARGFGALIGPFLGQRLVRSDGRRLFMVLGGSMILYGGAYALLPSAGTLWAAVACVVVAHLGGGAQWVLSTYGLQATTEDRYRGRVLSADFGLANLSIGVSSAVAGVASERLGLTWTAWVLAGTSAAFGFAWLAWTHKLWRAGSDPLGPPA